MIISGPLRGIDHWVAGGGIKTIHIIPIYDECACNFSNTGTSTALALGGSATVPISLTSQNPSIYGTYGDSCDRATVIETTGTGSSVSTISGQSATVGSSDPNMVGQYTLNYGWQPEDTNTGALDAFNFALEIQPTCGYSPISFTTRFLPVTPAIEETTTFQIPG